MAILRKRTLAALKRSVAATLVGGRGDLFRKVALAADFRAFVADTPAAGPVFPERYPERRGIHTHVAREIIGDAPVDYWEFGVYRGESITWWTDLNRHPDSRFFGFDTFSGLPADWGKKKAGAFSVDGATPDLDDPRVRFIPGLFQETVCRVLRDTPPRHRLCLHLDADLYGSTLFALTTMGCCIAPGTVLIFDEFTSLPHEFAAFRDYGRGFGGRFEIVARTAGHHHIALVRTA